VLVQLSDDLKPLAHFAYITGWRIGEILALGWAGVDFTARMARLEPGTTKNREGRMFPSTPNAGPHGAPTRTHRGDQQGDRPDHPPRVPSPWQAHQGLSWSAAVGLLSSGTPRSPPACPSPDGGTELSARRCPSLRGHEDGGTQDGGDLPSLRHRQRVRLAGGGRATAPGYDASDSPGYGHICGHNRAKEGEADKSRYAVSSGKDGGGRGIRTLSNPQGACAPLDFSGDPAPASRRSSSRRMPNAATSITRPTTQHPSSNSITRRFELEPLAGGEKRGGIC
jgi:hypothetical protein